jgi:hypothetical protein
MNRTYGQLAMMLLVGSLGCGTADHTRTADAAAPVNTAGASAANAGTGAGASAGSGAVDCNDQVITPGGPRARACVHGVPSGALVAETANGGTTVSLNGVVIANYPACPCPATSVTGGGAPLDAGAPSTGSAECSISASDYDQSCKVDSDCVDVFEGQLCGSNCRCPNATINQSAQARYESVVSHADAGVTTCFCPCFGPSRCEQGVCVFHRCGD